MNKWYGYTARAALVFALLLCGHTAAFGQVKGIGKLGQLPNALLGVDKLGVEAILIPPATRTVLPILPALAVPGVTVRVAPPILPGTSASVTVGGQGSGPLIGINVSGPAFQLDVGGGALDTPLNQDVRMADRVAVSQAGGQTIERSLDQIPTCR
jgi:hypothetical protein